MQASELHQDRAVMESFRRAAMARLIASKTVPAWQLLAPSYAAISGVALSFYNAFTVGYLQPETITVDGISDATGMAGPLILTLLSLPALVLVGTAGVYSVVMRRRRLIRNYLNGEDIIDKPPMKSRDFVHLGFRLSTIDRIAFVALALALCSWPALAGFVWGAGDRIGPFLPWVGVWAVATIALFLFASKVTKTLFWAERDAESHHPRPLTGKASVLAKTVRPEQASTTLQRFFRRRS